MYICLQMDEKWDPKFDAILASNLMKLDSEAR